MTLLRWAFLTGLVVTAASCAPHSYQAEPNRGRPGQSSYYYPPPPRERADRNWTVTRNRGETDYELADSVLFALDSARISRGAEAELTQIADAARDQPDAEIWIEGHTDTSGTREHNWELSDARARAVADCLVRLGVAPHRLRSQGLGESGLAVQTPDEVREARNRRVVIRFIDPSHARAGYYPRRGWDN